MASPFKIFRKHEKVIIVVAGVLLLIAWLLGDALMNMARSFSNRSNMGKEVVATYNGGKITRNDLSALVSKRTRLTNILRQVYQLGYSQLKESNPDADVPPLSVIPVLPFHLQGEQKIEEAAILTEVMLQAAKQEGMSIDDEAVKKYLDAVGRGAVTGKEYMNLLSKLKFHGRNISDKFLIDGVRDAMLVSAYYNTIMGTATPPLPSQLWSTWLQFNDSIKLEVAAYPAKDYLAKVGEPTEADIKKMFEEFKETEATPSQEGTILLPPKTPGFRVPRKVSFQYLVVSHDKIHEKIAAEITDDEIKKYYEENKPRFIKPDDIGVQPIEEPADSPEDAKPEANSSDNTTEPSEEKDDSDKKTDSDSSSPETETAGESTTENPSEETPATEDAPKTTESAPKVEDAATESSTEDAASTGDSPEQETPEGSATPSEQEPNENSSNENSATESDSANRSVKSVFQLVNFQEDESAPSAEASAAEEPVKPTGKPAKPADDPAATEPGADAPSDSETEAAETPETPEKPAAESSDSTTPNTEDKPAASENDPSKPAVEPKPEEASNSEPSEPPASSESSENTATATPKTEYLPLEEVKDRIRDKIAAQKVLEEQSTIIKKIFERISPTFNAYQAKTLELPQDKISAIPPPVYKLDKIAKEFGVELKVLEKKSAQELIKIEALDNVTVPSQDGRRFPVINVLFNSSLYRPFLAERFLDEVEQISQFDRFLFIKTDEIPARVPKLDEVRDDVIKAWKLREASKLALEAAKKLEEEAKKEKVDSLTKLYELQGADAGKEVVETDFFVRKQISLNGQGIQPDNIFGVESPGPAFRDKVFKLKPGEFAVIPNHDQSIIYLVRMAGHAKNQEVLRQLFLNEVNHWPLKGYQSEEKRNLDRYLLRQKLEESTGLKFEVPIDVPRDRN